MNTRGFETSCNRCGGEGQIAMAELIQEGVGTLPQKYIAIRCKRCGYTIVTDGRGGPWKELQDEEELST